MLNNSSVLIFIVIYKSVIIINTQRINRSAFDKIGIKVRSLKIINSKIENKLKVLDGTKKLFNLSLNSRETKNVLSKDSKGDPNILELVINLNYKLSTNGKILVNKSLTQRSSYNNISDKFELSKSEDILKDNLVENLVSDIINSATNLMIDDN